MRAAVIGTGFLAQAYLRCLHYLGYHPLVLSRSWIDYTDPHELKFCLNNYGADLVINCAGYTGDTVDDCENDKQQCYHSNVSLARSVAAVCENLKTPLVHISSGCVFNGVGPFDETDTPNMSTFTGGQFYARCKADAEDQIYAVNKNVWSFRIRMPFSHIPHRRNWLTKLKKYDRILDGLNSVTWIDEFAMRSWQLWQKAPPGIYHATQKNPVRTIDVARMLKKNVEEYDPLEFLKHHVQRSAAVLDCSKFEKAYGTEFTDTMVALRWCISQMEAETDTTGLFTVAVESSPDLTMSAGASAKIG